MKKIRYKWIDTKLTSLPFHGQLFSKTNPEPSTWSSSQISYSFLYFIILVSMSEPRELFWLLNTICNQSSFNKRLRVMSGLAGNLYGLAYDMKYLHKKSSSVALSNSSSMNYVYLKKKQ